MSGYLRKIAKKVNSDICGVSVYGENGLNPSDVRCLARDYLKLTAAKSFGWLPPTRLGLFRWQCTVCKRKYTFYGNAYECCINK